MKNRSTYFLPVLLLVISLITVALVYKPAKQSSSKFKIAVTTTQLSDITSNLAGDYAQVDSILAPNVDPHEYEPTTEDARKIADADLIVENGVGLDRSIDKVISSSSAARKVTASDFVTVEKGDDSDPDGDPHIWFTVNNVEKISWGITDALKEADPENKDFYENNLNNYLDRLSGLDKYIREQIATVPVNERKIVTNHDAFGYYAREYGLTVVGSVIPGLSTESQPSAQETVDLINKIKEQNIKAIFTETSVSPKLEEQIADQAGVKVVSNLYGDTLGQKGTSGDTYIDMMVSNTDNIVSNIK